MLEIKICEDPLQSGVKSFFLLQNLDIFSLLNGMKNVVR